MMIEVLDLAATRLAWHYTIGDRAGLIFLDGFIQPATAHVPAGEKPCVWFSSRQLWEPTANKAEESSTTGKRRALTFEEMQRLPSGLWRFGRPVAALLDWRQIKIETGMSPAWAKGLVKSARKAGADPDFWYGSMEPIPVGDCVVQQFRDRKWQDLTEKSRKPA